MLLTLVPYLLVANISVNEADWKYGPEVIYDGKIEGFRPNHDEGINILYNTTLKLKCRSKNETVFRCLFREPKTLVKIVESSGERRVLNDSSTFEKEETIIDHIFDWNFDPSRVDPNSNIITESSMSEPLIDIIKNFIDLLTVPSNMATRNTSVFHTVEDSYAGWDCVTKYTLSCSKMNKNNVEKKKKKNFQKFIYPSDLMNYKFTIVPESKNDKFIILPELMNYKFMDPAEFTKSKFTIVPGTKILKGEKREIQRMRYLTDCSGWGWFTRFSKLGYDVHRNTTVSRIEVTDSGYNARNEIEIFSSDIKEPSFYRPYAKEIFTLNLANVGPAEGLLPEIKDPKPVSPLAVKPFLSSFLSGEYPSD